MSKHLRTPAVSLAAIALVTGIVACSDASANQSAQQDELKRDLELASATTMKLADRTVDPTLLNSLETKPLTAPAPAVTVKRGPGTRALRSATPTVRATADVEAEGEEEGVLETLAEAPVPDVSEPVAVAPRPSTPVIVATGMPAGDYGTGSGGGGVFGGGSGGGGVVLRGGGVHGDNCELHRRPRGTSRGPVYVPTIPVASLPATRPSTRRGTGLGARPSPRDRGPATASAPAPSSPTPRSRPSVTRRGL